MEHYHGTCYYCQLYTWLPTRLLASPRSVGSHRLELHQTNSWNLFSPWEKSTTCLLVLLPIGFPRGWFYRAADTARNGVIGLGHRQNVRVSLIVSPAICKWRSGTTTWDFSRVGVRVGAHARNSRSTPPGGPGIHGNWGGGGVGRADEQLF